jgi:hypothetical protein
MLFALAWANASGAYPQSMAEMMASTPRAMASWTSPGARFGSYWRSRICTVQPSAWAASAAALTGRAALGDAWLGERIATFLPLAAMRVVESGGRKVPLYSVATVSRASVMMSTGGALPDRDALGVADPVGASASSLQAAVPATNATTARNASSVRISGPPTPSGTRS